MDLDEETRRQLKDALEQHLAALKTATTDQAVRAACQRYEQRVDELLAALHRRAASDGL